jgi:peptidoglycan hydrolase-like protein with peptidoglycan-binding domain
MFFVSKVVNAGLVFTLLTLGIAAPRPTPLAPRGSLSGEAPGETHRSDVKAMQQTLQGETNNRGKVGGVLGLRTRASVRGFQKAGSQPVTGHSDFQMADRLGVKPGVREAASYETAQDKPSAGIKWARGSGRTRKTQRKPVKE